MIDFFHDFRPDVPLKYITSQPPPYILNALLFKMKADNLRYIYECLSGDNGLLSLKDNNGTKFKDIKVDFSNYLDRKSQEEIRKGADGKNDDDVVSSAIYYKVYNDDKIESALQKLQSFYKNKMSLLKFLEHEIVFEYEKAKD